MVEFTFTLAENDALRLFAVKDLQGYEDLTGNEYAEQIVTREIRRLFPGVPEYDDAGELINADGYKGNR